MEYGHFDGKNKEYVITRPDTPLPWINYLGCEEYCGLMSNTAGGYSFYKDPLKRRLIRYRYNNIPSDLGGRYLYIRDNKSNDFWSASWQPVRKDLDKYEYECRHGLGYTKITSTYAGIKTTTTYFVPLKENLEIWMIDIKNLTRRKRDISIVSFVEFCLWDALADMADYQYNLNIGETGFKDGVIYHLTSNRVGQNHLAYFACTNGKVAGFESERMGFLGPYGTLEAPAAVKRGKGNGSIACGWSPVGSHFVPIKLNTGDEKSLIFILGFANKKKDVPKALKKFKTKDSVLKELKKLASYWEENLNKFSVDTEDPEVNEMVNLWNQYQCRTTFNWSRSASYYESGIGRGMGYRDSCQDTLGFVHQIPKKARERIIDLASNQNEDGSACHQYSPLTKKGREEGRSDDHLWLVYAVASYIKETGDVDFLDEDIPYTSGLTGTLYEHLDRAIEYTMAHLGHHGLPLIGGSDWNDCLNLDTGKNQAETVMVAEMLVAGAKEMAVLADLQDLKQDKKKFLHIAEKMSEKINEVAWDGAWYMRAFTDDGEPVGSKANNDGKIFLETQPWAVISGVAENGKDIKCMDSVKKHLATKYGIILQQPAYKKYHNELGGVSLYPPGLKENAGIFCHPNPWAMIAECMLGRGDQAFEYYKAILPLRYNDIAEIRKVEPYVYCQIIAGRDHKDFGEGKNSWLTGTAAWSFVAISQWILGIRPDYKGLLIDPCIPSSWKGFSVKKHFRNADYYITVRNPEHINKGIKKVTVDGKKLTSNLVPAFEDGKEHYVEVIMG